MTRPALVTALVALSSAIDVWAAAAADPLVAALGSLQFLNEGVTNSTTVFAYGRIACGYLEPENVTNYLSGWREGGACPYVFQSNSTPAPPVPCGESAIDNCDRGGNDLASAPVDSDDVNLCISRCCGEPACVAWVYAASAPADFGGCTKGGTCCYMKSAPGQATPSGSLQCGTNNHTIGPDVGLTPPPLGIRSAVPLGGLGAGSLELRGDGTFHEVTIHNAHPAGGAKYGVLADALLGARVTPVGGAPVARALRTAPPAYAAPGVAALAYSGTYPASRLSVREEPSPFGAGVAVDLFAYSVLKPGDEQTSSAPAVAFSLRVANGGAADADVALYLALPWGAINDCDRTGNSSSVFATAPAASAAACAAACAAAAAPLCGAWTFSAAGNCSLTADAPWPRFRLGGACAVSGAWGPTSGADALVFTADGHGAPAAAAQPGLGSVALQPVGATTVDMRIADTPGELWAAFAAAGGEPQGASGTDPRSAGFGSVSATVRVPAGATGVVSIVFAWHFPNKDWWHEPVGNFYANLWPDAAAVAAQLAAPGRLASIAEDLASHHAAFLGPATPSAGTPPSPLPVWLRDSLVNQFSHMRSMHFLADGRMREYEANDCPGA